MLKRLYRDDNYVRAETRRDGKRHPSGVREFEETSNKGRPINVLLRVTTTYLCAPDVKTLEGEATGIDGTAITSNEPKRHVAIKETIAIAKDM